MHYIAPIPIIFGIVSVIAGFLWLVAAGSEEDGGPSTGLFFAFGSYYLAMRVIKNLLREPMSVLPGFGFVLGGAGLIWLGVVMI